MALPSLQVPSPIRKAALTGAVGVLALATAGFLGRGPAETTGSIVAGTVPAEAWRKQAEASRARATPRLCLLAEEDDRGGGSGDGLGRAGPGKWASGKPR